MNTPAMYPRWEGKSFSRLIYIILVHFALLLYFIFFLVEIFVIEIIFVVITRYGCNALSYVP